MRRRGSASCSAGAIRGCGAGWREGEPEGEWRDREGERPLPDERGQRESNRERKRQKLRVVEGGWEKERERERQRGRERGRGREREVKGEKGGAERQAREWASGAGWLGGIANCLFIFPGGLKGVAAERGVALLVLKQQLVG